MQTQITVTAWGSVQYKIKRQGSSEVIKYTSSHDPAAAASEAVGLIPCSGPYAIFAPSAVLEHIPDVYRNRA